MFIQKLTPSARVTEVDGLATVLIKLYQKEVGLSQDAFLKVQFENLSRQSTALSEAIKRDRAQSNVDEKDNARDEAVRNLAGLIDGYTFIPVPDKKEAALALKAIFDKYGRAIVSETYVDETSFIRSLLTDLESKESKEHIAKLEGMDSAIMTLRTTQAEFMEVYTDWAKAKNEESATVSASSLKKPMLDLINGKLVPYLTAMDDGGTYTDFASLVDTEIGKVNNNISSRRGKKEEKA